MPRQRTPTVLVVLGSPETLKLPGILEKMDHCAGNWELISCALVKWARCSLNNGAGTTTRGRPITGECHADRYGPRRIVPPLVERLARDPAALEPPRHSRSVPAASNQAYAAGSAALG
jgi:hypothetical protein